MAIFASLVKTQFQCYFNTFSITFNALLERERFEMWNILVGLFFINTFVALFVLRTRTLIRVRLAAVCAIFLFYISYVLALVLVISGLSLFTFFSSVDSFIVDSL